MKRTNPRGLRRRLRFAAPFAVAFAAGCGSIESATDPPSCVIVADSGPPAEEAASIPEEAGEAGTGDCPIQSSPPLVAGAARSAAFTGTEAAYYALYSIGCGFADECAAACVAAGGSATSCAVGSACVAPSFGDAGAQCLAPTYWRNVKGALSQSGMTFNAAELTLVTGDFHDALVLTGFHASLPDDATVVGLAFKIDRNADDAFATDDSVRILKDGSPVGIDHRQTGAWPRQLTNVTYGGMGDTWGVDWSLNDVRSDGFGISVAPKYTALSDGNDRAHVDVAAVTIFYTTPCHD
jgi:hypothetical protein